jgi:hypothetical protein
MQRGEGVMEGTGLDKDASGGCKLVVNKLFFVTLGGLLPEQKHVA